MKIAVIGQSLFGQEVYCHLRKEGHEVVGVFTVPDKDGKADPLGEWVAQEQGKGVPGQAGSNGWWVGAEDCRVLCCLWASLAGGSCTYSTLNPAQAPTGCWDFLEQSKSPFPT